jgi:hypothetical protein
MKLKIVITLLSTLLVQAAFGITTIVPGTSDPWLAGMPNGSTASIVDSAPAESPVFVTGLSITSGTAYTFSASGGVANDPAIPLFGPDGWTTNVTMHFVNYTTTGAENGIANLNAPLNSLIGVFLGPNQPNLNPTPSALDFSTSASQNYLTLSPQLQQPFFIGDGLTSSLLAQQVIAPVGATRLFLGTMDSQGWSNNPGSFTVQVVPEPNIAGIAIVGLAVWTLCKKCARRCQHQALS